MSVPKDWELKKLSEIAEIRGGKRLPKGEVLQNENNGYPYITVSDMYFGGIDTKKIKFVPIHVVEKVKRYRVKKDDLIIAVAGNTLGIISRIPDKLDNANLTENADMITNIKINKEYLFYVLSSDIIQRKIEDEKTTNAQPKLALERIRNFDIPIPINESEINKIAEILITWDKAIELKEKLIEQKKEQKKGLMQKLLTGEVRLPGFDGEWKEVKLAKVVKKIKGKAVEYLEGGKFPAIDMDYLESGKFKNYSNDATVFAEKNDVLLLWDGSRAGMAFTGVEGAVGSTFVKLECKSIHNIFLQKHLEMNEKKIQRLREGSGIPHVPKDFLDYYKVKMPSMEEQKAIANVLNNMDRDLDLLLKEVTYLKKQKQGLMQLLLTGKVRVKV